MRQALLGKPGDGGRLPQEALEDRLGRDDLNPLALQRALQAPGVVVGVTVGQEDRLHPSRGDPLLQQPLRGVHWRVDQDPAAAQPEHEAGRLAVGVEAMTRPQDRDPEGGGGEQAHRGVFAHPLTPIRHAGDRLEGDRVIERLVLDGDDVALFTPDRDVPQGRDPVGVEEHELHDPLQGQR